MQDEGPRLGLQSEEKEYRLYITRTVGTVNGEESQMRQAAGGNTWLGRDVHVPYEKEHYQPWFTWMKRISQDQGRELHLAQGELDVVLLVYMKQRGWL